MLESPSNSPSFQNPQKKERELCFSSWINHFICEKSLEVISRGVEGVEAELVIDRLIHYVHFEPKIREGERTDM